MVYLLGTDEAGYGPNLGPLCIAASAWQVTARDAKRCLYECLAGCIAAECTEGDHRLSVADSKALYKPGGTLLPLERGVLAMLAQLDRLPRSWRDIWRLDPAASEQLAELPWHDGYDEPLPTCEWDLGPARNALADGLAAARVQLCELSATVLFPQVFNHAVAACDNKAEVLSLSTLRLARRLIDGLSAGPVVVYCDKHGGRMRYAALLQHVFDDGLVSVRRETAALGIYHVRMVERLIEFRFQPKGERHLPTALASMTAKYLRELAMRPFNRYWQNLVPGLRPTAGYPSDSRMFLNDIRPAKSRLQLADTVLWRER